VLFQASPLCRLIKNFEQEARAENMPASELTNRKKGMVQELNNFITQKKEHSNALDAKKELVAESSSRGQQKPLGGDRFCSSCNVRELTFSPQGRVSDARYCICRMFCVMFASHVRADC